MSNSEERRRKLVKEHWDKELPAWKFFRFELERRWDLQYPGFHDRDYIHSVEYVAPGAESDVKGVRRFLKQHFNPARRGEFQDTILAQADGLAFRPRQRLRCRYHFSLTSLPQPGFSVALDGPRVESWHLYLTRDSLAAGMKVATALDYAVTLSTPNAGASQRTFHFLAMPRLLRFSGNAYPLYEWLAECPSRLLVSSGNVVIELAVYPAFCVRIYGEIREVAAVAWRLADLYAALLSFNLVILPGSDVEHSSVLFFPRPLAPNWEGPDRYAAKCWSFGAFEMGGFFVQGDEAVYAELTYDALCGFLNEVSIFNLPEELRRISAVLEEVAPRTGTREAIRSYCEQVHRMFRQPLFSDGSQTDSIKS